MSYTLSSFLVVLLVQEEDALLDVVVLGWVQCLQLFSMELHSSRQTLQLVALEPYQPIRPPHQIRWLHAAISQDICK